MNGLERGVDRATFIEKISDTRHCPGLFQSVGWTSRQAVEISIDPIELLKIVLISGQITEKGLRPVDLVRANLGLTQTRRRGIGSRLEKGIRRPADARNIDACTNPVRLISGLIRELADITRRIDIGNIVSNDPQFGLGRIQRRGSDIENGIDRHQQHSRRQEVFKARLGTFCRPAGKSDTETEMLIWFNILIKRMFSTPRV